MMCSQWKIFEKVPEDPEIGPLRPTFNKPLKVAQIDVYTRTDAKPVEKFWENDQRPEFLHIWGPKNWPSEAHILHTS